MKLILEHSQIRTAESFHPWVQEYLKGLLPLLQIESARVRLEYSAEASPGYRASAHLAVPGPDLRAEVVDHTARNALTRLLTTLREKAMERAMRRLRRMHVPRLSRQIASRY